MVLVKDFMTSMIITAEVHALVVDAAKLMAVENVGSLIVTKDEVLAGMVTRKDIIAAQLLSDDAFHALTLEDVMETPVVTVSPDAEIGQVIAIMNQTGRTYIPVIEGDDITGVVSSSDVIRALATLKLIATGAEK
jgi:CBS domain-containing protein